MIRTMKGATIAGALACSAIATPRTAAAQVDVEAWGGSQRLTFHSGVLGERRRLYVRLPAGYDESTREYPVLYVLDGEFFFESAGAGVQFLSEIRYIRDHPVPEMIVVGVVNQDRNRDFTPTHAPIQGTLRFPTSGGAARFSTFLEREVFPLIETTYRTEPYRILAGWSLGGLFAVDTYLRRPEMFSAYLAISPSLWWDGDRELPLLKTGLRAGALSARPLVVTLGSEEGGDMDRTVRNGIAPLLGRGGDAGPVFRYVEIPGEGHSYVPYKAMLNGLRAVYHGWTMPDSVAAGGLATVVAFYNSLSVHRGYRVQVPEGAFYRTRIALARQDRLEEALAVARRAAAEYPQSSSARAGLAWTLLQLGDSASAITSYEQAVELEEEMPEPDSESLLSYRQAIARLRP